MSDKQQMLCACGKPMHLTNAQKMVLIMRGIEVTDTRKVIREKKMYEIPIYYIVAHGLEWDVVPTLGFPEIQIRP